MALIAEKRTEEGSNPNQVTHLSVEAKQESEGIEYSALQQLQDTIEEAPANSLL